MIMRIIFVLIIIAIFIYEIRSECETVGRFPVPGGSCEQFFVCARNKVGILEERVEKCSEGTLYSAKYQRCLEGDNCTNLQDDLSIEFECSKSGYFSDKNSCKQFVNCLETEDEGVFIPIKQICPAGTVFSEDNGHCIEGTDCYPVTTKPPEEFICPKSGRFPDKNSSDCSAYFLCTKGADGNYLYTKSECPTTLKFSWTSRRCVIRSSFACPNIITTTTEAPLAIIVDFKCPGAGKFPDNNSKDCRSYFLCTENEGILVPEKKTCAGKTVFSWDSRKCVPKESFTCPNIVSTTTTVTTPEIVSTSLDTTTEEDLTSSTLEIVETESPESETTIELGTTSVEITETEPETSTTLESTTKNIETTTESEKTTISTTERTETTTKTFETEASTTELAETTMEPPETTHSSEITPETTEMPTTITTELAETTLEPTETTLSAETTTESTITTTEEAEITSEPSQTSVPETTEISTTEESETTIETTPPQTTETITTEATETTEPGATEPEITTETTTELTLEPETTTELKTSTSEESSSISESSSGSTESQESTTNQGVETTSTEEENQFVCPSVGLFPDDNSPTCKAYFVCTKNPDGSLSSSRNTCLESTIFSKETLRCVAKNSYQCRGIVTTTTISPPNFNGTCEQAGKFPDPDSKTCETYKFCLLTGGEYVMYTFKCPSGTLFDPSLSKCTPNYLCPSSVIPSISPSAFPQPIFNCSGQGKYSDPETNDCKSYIYCLLPASGDFLALKFICPDNFLFDPSSEICSRDYQCPIDENSLVIDTSFRGDVVCHGTTGRYYDHEATDCRSYILCLMTKKAGLVYAKLKCPERYVFSKMQRACILGSKCLI